MNEQNKVVERVTTVQGYFVPSLWKGSSIAIASWFNMMCAKRKTYLRASALMTQNAIACVANYINIFLLLNDGASSDELCFFQFVKVENMIALNMTNAYGQKLKLLLCIFFFNWCHTSHDNSNKKFQSMNATTTTTMFQSVKIRVEILKYSSTKKLNEELHEHAILQLLWSNHARLSTP